MNIYADRGNILFLQRRCEWRGHRLRVHGRGPGRGLRSRRSRPDLHRRRPGPRPGAGRRGHAADASATRSPAPSTTAPPCSPSAAATSCSATATSSATSASRASASPTSRPCASPGPRLIGNVAIEADLGDGRRVLAGFENHGGRTHLGADARAARPGPARPRQQRQRRSRGRAAPEPDRHLPARPAAAEERLAGRPPDRAGARAPHGIPARSWSRSRTSSSRAAHAGALRAAERG